jgi:hypothetical protein
MNDNMSPEVFLLTGLLIIALLSAMFLIVAEETASREVIYDCEQNRRYEIVEYRFHFDDKISYKSIPHEYCIRMQDENQ